jgi:hypothetical protein
MSGHLTYHVTQARIDDLRRSAADRRLVAEGGPQPKASLLQMLRHRGYRRVVGRIHAASAAPQTPGPLRCS